MNLSYSSESAIKLLQRSNRAYYTDDQLKLLLEAAQGSVLESAIVLTVTYGLRRGETLGLKWSAVDSVKSFDYVQ